MVSPVACAATMELKMLMLLAGWKNTKDLTVVPSSGVGQYLLFMFLLLCTIHAFYSSVHNTRIERLWYDVTNGFGRKWKIFFMDLEAHHGLNPTIPEHIWLLHYLFLPAIQQDAQDWAAA